MFLKKAIVAGFLSLSLFSVAIAQDRDTPKPDSTKSDTEKSDESLWNESDLQEKFQNLPDELKDEFRKVIDATEERLREEKADVDAKKTNEEKQKARKEVDDLRKDAKEAIKTAMEFGTKTRKSILKKTAHEAINQKKGFHQPNRLTLEGLKRFYSVLKSLKDAKDMAEAREKMALQLLKGKEDEIKQMMEEEKVDKSTAVKLLLQVLLHSCSFDGCDADLFDLEEINMDLS
jgi:hypothetical protein